MAKIWDLQWKTYCARDLIYYIIKMMLNLGKERLPATILIIFVFLFIFGGSALATLCVNNACSDTANECGYDTDCGAPVACNNGVCNNGTVGPCVTANQCGGVDNSSGVGRPFTPPVQPTIPTQGLPGFGQLIASIFTWSLNVLGIVVFIMIISAGFKWFTAAGNTAKANEARSQITNAILGAIILLASWIILNTINPDLRGQGPSVLPGIGTSQNP